MYQTIEKPRKRLSIRTRRLQSLESPKTPPICIELDSPTYRTPISSPSRMDIGDCSTPLNSRKRSCFPEESPSQDYEPHSPNLITMSQEMRPIGIEVTWQWNSPKRQVDDEQLNKIEKFQTRRKIIGISRFPNKKEELKPIQQKNSNVLTGFYRFQKDLLNVKLTSANVFQNAENSNTSNDNMESASNLEKENVRNDVSVDDKTMNIEQKNNEKSTIMNINMEECYNKNHEDDNIADKTLVPDNINIKSNKMPRYCSDEFMDDSDTDSVLLTLSQEIEMTLKSTSAEKNTIKNSYKKNLVNDSFDECLSRIPLDDIIMQTQDNSSINANSAGYTSGYCSAGPSRGHFGRHVSMPDENVNNKKSKSILRYESLPISNNQIETINCSSSSESLSSSISLSPKTRCSSEEIAYKKRIALERLKAKKQQILLSSFSLSKNYYQNSKGMKK